MCAKMFNEIGQQMLKEPIGTIALIFIFFWSIVSLLKQ